MLVELTAELLRFAEPDRIEPAERRRAALLIGSDGWSIQAAPPMFHVKHRRLTAAATWNGTGRRSKSIASRLARRLTQPRLT